jgi:peptide/nickel transport system permease protein
MSWRVQRGSPGVLRLIASRLLGAVILLVLVTAVVFAIFNLLPTADPAELRAGRAASPERIESVRESLRLDDPVHVRFVRYLAGVFTPLEGGPLNLGTSIFQEGEPVRAIVFDRLPATAFLIAGAALLWLVIAIPVGVISATRQHSILDRTTMITTIALVSAPVFWLGLVGLYLFAEHVGVISIFPGVGGYGAADGFFAKAWALVLPWTVLAAASAALYARYVRSQMIETMGEDYIRTARAKGIAERRVVLRHGLRAALTPVVTLLALDVGVLMAGNAILTESVFNIPGVGGELVTAIGRADYEVIQGIVLFGAFFIVAFNLLADIAYTYLDPRVRPA